MHIAITPIHIQMIDDAIACLEGIDWWEEEHESYGTIPMELLKEFREDISQGLEKEMQR